MRVMIGCLALTSLWAQRAGDWLNRGQEAFRAARYAEAVTDFQNAVKLDSSSVTARLYLAAAYMQQYIPGATSPENLALAAQAEENFQRVLTQDPQNREALNSLASLDLNQKKWDEAQKWFERLVALDSNSADAYYSMGFIAWSKVYPEWKQARERSGMKPDDPGPLPDLGVKQDFRARFEVVLATGITNLQKALELNPLHDDAMAYMNLLFRTRADLQDTKEEYLDDIAAADRWVQKTLDTKKLKASLPLPPPPDGAPGAPPSRIRVGAAVLEQHLVHKVDPIYPALAAQARISGTVRLSVVITREGNVTNAMVLSGHPLLVPAALQAVKQWLYRPTYLNGAPVEVATEVEVKFDLDANPGH